MASFLDTLFGGGAEAEAADKDRAAAQLYQQQGINALQQGYQTGTGAIQSGIGAYTPLANLGATYSSGAPTYMGAIGAGTPDQGAAARAAFQSSPGNQAVLDQAAQALARTRATSGMGATGNAAIDQILGGAGITAQQYQQFVNNLQSAGQMGVAATGAAAQGQATGYNNLASLAQNYGQNQAGIYGNTMQTDVGANNLQAAGEAAGAKNLLGAGLSLATLGMGGNPFGGSLTGGSSGGGFSSSLLGQGLTGLKNLNLGQSLFGGGSPSGYGA
jgi:hypothetical protein